MQVIDGDFKGKKAAIAKDIIRGPVIEVAGKSYSLKKDVARCKELSKHESRTMGQLIICLLLAVTFIGLPIAALLFFMWKRIQFTAGIQTSTGEKFIVESNSRSDHKLISKFYGLGAAADF